MKNIFIFLLVIFFSCAEKKKSGLPQIIINSTAGDIEVELYPAQASKTVAAFLQYIDAGYYKNACFYRVVLQEGFTPALNTGLIQGGVWEANNKQQLSVQGIPHETTNTSGLSHTDGTISLARTAPGTASTEFFICIGDQTQYDFGNNGVGDKQGYAAFGRVIKGMDVVRAIQQQRSNGESFTEKILIKNIERE